jgi:hypothetical protein
VSWRDPLVDTPYGRVRASNLEGLRRQQEAWRHEEPSPAWQAIERAYRATGKVRPSQLEAAQAADVSETTMRRWVRLAEIARWSDVHRRIAGR